LSTDDADERRAALDEGKSLLQSSSMGHNHFNFCEDGIDACLQAGDWDGLEWFARHLQDYTRAEPLPFSEFVIARGRALADFGRGERGGDLAARLRQLQQQARSVGLLFQVIAIENALAEL
jgi:hypothetical protein